MLNEINYVILMFTLKKQKNSDNLLLEIHVT